MTSHEPPAAPHGAVGGGRYLPFRYGTFGDLRPGDRWLTAVNGDWRTTYVVEALRVEDRGRGNVLLRAVKEDGISDVPLAYTKDSDALCRILTSELHATHAVDLSETRPWAEVRL